MDELSERIAALSPAKRRLLEQRLKQQQAAAAAGARLRPAEGARLRALGPDEGPFAPSFSQERLWLLDQLDPGNPAFNVCATATLRGQLDRHAFERSIQAIVARHEVLRTAFEASPAGPVQVVRPQLEIPLARFDLRGLPESEQRAERARRVEAEALWRFELQRGPLLRLTLLRLGDAEHEAIFSAHHIVCDGTSIQILMGELVALYAAYAKGGQAALPPLAFQYKDFAAWQRRHVASPRFQEKLATWTQRLAGPLPRLELPSDRPRAAARGALGRRIGLDLPVELHRQLRELSREAGVTFFTTTLAAFLVLLHRLTGQEDLVVGTPVANRSRSEFEELIGYFVNLLPIRAALAPELPFRRLLEQLCDASLEAFENQEVPLEKILEAVAPGRDAGRGAPGRETGRGAPSRETGRGALFDVTFNLLDTTESMIDLPGLHAEYRSELPGTRFEMTAYVLVRGDTLRLELAYDTELFDEATIRERLEQLALLLRQFVAAPELPIGRASLVTPRAAALLPGSGPPAGLVWSAALPERVAAQAQAHPGRVAIHAPRGSWSYAELARRAQRVANHLLAQGLARGELVAIYAARESALVAALLGVLEAGGAFAVLDPSYPAASLIERLRLARPRAWIRLEEAGPLPDALAACLDELELRARLTLSHAGDDLGDVSASRPAPVLGPDDLAYVAFTSGTTGRPRGVLGSHAPLAHFVDWHAGRFGLGPSDRFSLLSGLAHDPLLRDVFTPLCLGATLCIPDPDVLAEPGALVHWLTRESVTVAHLTPAMERLRPREIRAEAPEAVVSLRYACFGGEALRRDDVVRLAEWAPDATCVNFYGATETPQAVACYVVPRELAAPEPAAAGELLPIGAGIEGVELVVVNAAGQRAGVGELGEILVRTPYLARGYLGDPEQSAQRFVANPLSGAARDRCYRTGDLGRYRRDGTVDCCGRADAQVKVRGFRVELGEVEGALRAHPAVREAAVVLRGDPARDGALVAYLVAELGELLSPSALCAFLAERLPDYMVPSAFVPLAALPLTPNGKLDRRALPVPESGAVLEDAYVAPRSATERELAALWSEILGLDGIGAHDDFFSLGGHSLLATQLVSRIRAGFGVEITIRQFFEAPSIAGLAALVDAARAAGRRDEAPPLVRVPREQPGGLPLAFAQEGLWFLDRLDPGATTYQMSGAVRLRGALDARALEQAFDAILRRHEALRTVFRSVDGRPVQCVQPAAGFALPGLERSGSAPEAREAELRRLLKQERTAPFDLEQGPLLRAQLVRFAPDEHGLLLTLHHIVADGWSIGVLLGELAALYLAFRTGAEPALPALPIQYADFACWQRGWLQGEVLERELAWWLDTLRGAPPALELPSDRPRPPVRTGRGAQRVFRLSEALSEALRRFSRERGVTLFTTLLAGFESWLHRLTGAEDLVVGVTSANRNRLELEPLIGMFVNTLVVRSDLSGDPSFREVLERVGEAALGAFAHQDLPFDRLVEAIRPERNLGRAPLFQVGFAVQATRLQGGEVAGLRIEPVENEVEWAKNDLHFTIDDGAPALVASVEYSSELFDAATIERFFRLYERLLVAALAEPERRVSTLPLLGDEERREALAHALPARLPALPEAGPCLGVQRRFAAQAARTPDATAVVAGERTLSYAELDADANRLAQHLRRRGIGRGDVVGVCVERSPALLAALLGVLKAGAAYLPLDDESPEERLAFLLADAGAAALVAGAEAARRFAGRLPVVDLDGDAQAIAAERADDLALPVAPEDLAYVIYTSGSTGVPKGVMVEHRSLDAYIASAVEAFGIQASDRVLQFANACFDASAEEIYTALVSGATLVLRDDAMLETGEGFLARCAALGVSVLDLPTAFWHEIVSELARRDLTLPSSVRLVVIGGERALPERVRAWLTRVGRGVRLVNSYGPTETTIVATLAELGELAPDEVGSEVPIGRPVGPARAYVLDGELQPLPVGVPGELHIGGVGVARGYLGRPELTAERFVPDPFDPAPGARLYKTGDRVRRLPDGRLAYVGRSDAQVKIRGYRIEPAELERALRAQPGVEDAAVVVREEEPGSPQLVAYVVAAAGAAAARPGAASGGEPGAAPPALAATLRRALRATLPEYMLPSALVLLDALPRGASGKLERSALPAPDRETLSAAESFVAPRDRTEQQLAEIWAAVLGMQRVGVHDNFFELGGDSIRSLQIISRARQAGLSLSTRQIFEHQTIAALAVVAEVAAEQGVVSGPVALVPAQQRLLDELAEPAEAGRLALFALRPGVAPATLRNALGALLVHHDALRLRFRREDGGWRQEHALPDGEVPWSTLDLSGLSEAERAAAVEAAGRDARARLELERGPLLRAVHFDLGPEQPGTLLCVVHPLLADDASWGILLEDLASAYGQLLRGGPVRLPAKTASFQEWAERLAQRTGSAALEGELGFWQENAAPAAGELPPEASEAPAVAAGEVRARVALDARETGEFRSAQRAYGTRAQELVLAALVRAWATASGEPTLRLELETDARDGGLPGLDVSRTVGCLVAPHPLRLEAGTPGDPGGAIRGAKECLRSVPGRGLGYALLRRGVDDGEAEPAARLGAQPRPRLRFRWCGNLDAALGAEGPLAPAELPAGLERAVPTLGQPGIDCEARLAGGRLELALAAALPLPGGATPAAFAKRVLRELCALVAHCHAPEAGGYTPSDFPLAKLSQAALDRVLAGLRDVEDVYPLSPTQQGMFLHSLYASGSIAYFTQASGLFEGPLDLAAFRKALAALVERHALLRTSVVWEDLPEPLQIVQRQVELPLELLDWRDLPAPEQEQRLERLLAEDRARGFDLTRAPLLRCSIVRQRDDAHTLVFSNHHLIVDGWSQPVLVKELLALYAAFARGEQPHLAPAPRYRDFIAWLGEQDQAAAEAFWRRQLSGFSEPTPICTRPAPRGAEGVAEERYDERELWLSRAQSAELEAFARGTGLTLSNLVQGAWALLLGHYTSRDDVVFGATVSGRSAGLPDMDTRVGLYINTLPVRVRMAPDTPLLDWLRGLQRQHTELLEYEYSPLMLTQACSEVPGGRALFDSIVVFENYPVDDALRSAGELAVRQGQTFQRTSYPLTLVAMPGERFLLRVLFDAGRCDEGVAERMLGHLRTILEACVADPSQPLRELPILTPAERERALGARGDEDRAPAARGEDLALAAAGVTAAAQAPHEDLLVHERFEAHAAAAPQAVAVEDGAQALSYAELDVRANRLAHHLRAQGIGAESRVGLCLPRSCDAVVALLAVLKAGGATVPLDPDQPAERLAFLVQDAGLALVLADATTRASLPGQAVPVLDLNLAAAAIAAQPPTRPDAGVRPEQLAYVVYTSGSTGRPKGVAVEQRALARYVAAASALYAITPADRVLQFASLGFDASVEEIHGALACGATLVLRNDAMLESTESFLRELGERHITLVDLPTAFWHEITAGLRDAPLPLPECVRLVIIGGEAALAERVAEWRERVGPRVRLVNTYGPTECTVVATACELGGGPGEPVPDPPPIGQPLPGVEALVLDAWRRPVPDDVPGELHLGGAQLARGYLGRPELDAERFLPHPFRSEPGARLYATGDRVRRRPDGALEWLGRVDQQVKIRGFRVEPGEVEGALAAHPDLAEAVVVAREIPSFRGARDRRLVAYAVARGEAAPGPDALRQFLRARLPEYMVPSGFVFLDALPRTPSGKLDRAALPDVSRLRPELASAYAVPRTPEERTLARALAEVLGVDQVGVHDDFFALGGNSLLAVRFLTRVGRLYGVRLPLRALFEGPSVAELAVAVGALLRGESLAEDAGPAEDLRAEIALDPEIRPASGAQAAREAQAAGQPAPAPQALRHVFLTGATGFLGAFLLRDLLEATSAEIHCLVRASDPEAGRRRLEAALAGYGLWQPAYAARIRPVLGNLSEQLLGLAPEAFDALARRIDAIYHCGANVNFLYPYRAMKPPNVLGTQEVLRLACRARPLPVHFVSTLSVLEGARDGRVRESDALEQFPEPEGGYARSKWVAEGLVALARERGVPIAVYRPGRVVGDSRTGAWNTSDHVSRLAGGCLALGSVPAGDPDLAVDASPVDWVSRAIVQLSLRPASLGRVFHLFNPQPVRVGDALERLRARGYPLRSVPESVWLDEIRRFLVETPENPLFPMLPLLEERGAARASAGEPGEGQRGAGCTLERANTEQGLGDASLDCPPIDAEVIDVYLDYFESIGLARPPGRAEADAR